MATEIVKIQLRRDTAANWTSANPTLSSGELGFEVDTLRFKIGDGATVWAGLGYESALAPNGTRASAIAVTAVGGVSLLGVMREMQFVRGSGGPVTVTATPQIEAGEVVGQELILVGTSDANTVTIANGNGLELNGTCMLENGSRIYLTWDGTVWGEVSRNDI